MGRSCPNLASERKDLSEPTGPIFKALDNVDDRIRKLSKRSGKGWDPEISLRQEALMELERDLLNATSSNYRDAEACGVKNAV